MSNRWDLRMAHWRREAAALARLADDGAPPVDDAVFAAWNGPALELEARGITPARDERGHIADHAPRPGRDKCRVCGATTTAWFACMYGSALKDRAPRMAHSDHLCGYCDEHVKYQCGWRVWPAQVRT